ncbi:MAG TPA: hypothetical protein VGK00_13365 [Anaerolineales bacterium]|jgi:hypothetical protein
MITTSYFIDAVGWTGAAMVLIAYWLISIQWIRGNSFSYQFLNVTGALMLVINSYYLKAYPSVGVNAAWVGIAAIALLREWWRGPAAAYKKVTLKLSKRINLRMTTLQRIKLPIFRHQDRRVRKNQPSASKLA